MAGILVVKIGGRAAEDDAIVSSLAQELALREKAGDKVVLVHGGGAVISDLQAHYGVKPLFIDGLRQTAPEEMPLVDMALAGSVNKRLVRLFRKSGLNAWGLSGADAGIFTAVSIGGKNTGAPDAANGGRDAGTAAEKNRTGEVSAVNPRPIELLWEGGWFPIFAPPASDKDENGMNINADEAALAMAAALKADSLIFLSDVPGVLEKEQTIPHLTPSSVEKKITDGVIAGGMIPKTRSATGALAQGVGAVIIGEYSKSGDLKELLSGGRGTRIDKIANRGE